MALGRREIKKSIFKAYDIRGLYPEEIDDDAAYRIARAFVSALKCKRVVVGHDMRDSAATFEAATIRGLTDQGADVVPMGLTSTPMYYFGVNYLNGDAGVQCSASHNPAEYNGYKMTGHERDTEHRVRRATKRSTRPPARAISTIPRRRALFCRRRTCSTHTCEAVLDNAGHSRLQGTEDRHRLRQRHGRLHPAQALCEKVGNEPDQALLAPRRQLPEPRSEPAQDRDLARAAGPGGRRAGRPRRGVRRRRRSGRVHRRERPDHPRRLHHGS